MKHLLRGLGFFFFVVATAAADAAPATTHIVVQYRAGTSATAVAKIAQDAGYRVREFIDADLGLALFEAVRATPDDLEHLRAQPAIISVEEDQTPLVEGVASDRLQKSDWARTVKLAEGLRAAVPVIATPVKVAIPDTGIKADHRGLKNHLLRGWDMMRNVPSATDDFPDHGHGTMVAGIIAAVSPTSKLMGFKTCTAQRKCSVTASIKAIVYAVKNGMRLVNASWGSKGPSPALETVLNWAFRQGTLVISASGNYGNDLDQNKFFYPTSFRNPSSISVAATNGSGRVAGFSNYGVTTVHVAAPGDEVLSTSADGGYEFGSGTSFAAPMVTGVGALMLTAAPALTALELRNGLLNAVTTRPKLRERIATSGELNAAAALNQLHAGFQVWPSQLTLRPGDSFEFSAFDAQGPVRWSVSNEIVASIDERGLLLALTSGVIQVIATDASNRVAATRWLRVMLPPTGRKGS